MANANTDRASSTTSPVSPCPGARRDGAAPTNLTIVPETGLLGEPQLAVYTSDNASAIAAVEAATKLGLTARRFRTMPSVAQTLGAIRIVIRDERSSVVTAPRAPRSRRATAVTTPIPNRSMRDIVAGAGGAS